MPLKGACVTDGFWSLSYGIFAAERALSWMMLQAFTNTFPGEVHDTNYQ